MTNSLLSKLCLGTVQFGLDYGIANKRGKVPKEEAFGILSYARDRGIDTLDTAFSYGESEKVIGDFIAENRLKFKIISKTPELDSYSPKGVENMLFESLASLRQKSIYAYLIHRFEDFLKYEGFWPTLEEIKKRKIVKKIGFSIYRPQEIEVILDKNIDVDIIQVPYSIFDRRFEDYFDILKERGIEIYTRSAFLQGLAFLNLDELENDLEEARGHLEALEQIAAENGISKNAICLNFVLLNPLIDRVVIGVDSLNHIKENIENIIFLEKVKEIYGRLKELRIDNEEIILPQRWGKR